MLSRRPILSDLIFGCGRGFVFIVPRRATRLGKRFFFWSFLLLLGPLALTMHVHYDPTPRKPKDANG
jgi:hypothetical protein